MSEYEHWGPLLHWSDPDPDQSTDEKSRQDASDQIPDSLLLLPQSHSRFILPFAYAPQRLSDGQLRSVVQTASSARAWQLDKPKVSLDRQQYFTAETADVLYRRSRRGQLKQLLSHDRVGEAAAEQTFSLAGGTFEVTLSTPELILFEWPDAALRRNSNGAASTSDFANDPLLVGFLCHHASFPRHRRDGTPQQLQLKHLLWFNELYRHVREPFSGHRVERLEKLFAPEDLAAFQDAYFGRWFDALEWPVLCGNQFYSLFPDTWRKHSRDWIKGGSSRHRHAMCHPDSRAFVATFAQVRDGAHALLPRPSSDGTERVGAAGSYGSVALDADGGNRKQHLLHSHGWVALLNIDNPDQLTGITEYEKTWISDRSYTRWAHFGTLYGYTPHSVAAIAAPCLEPPLWRHFDGMYFDQTVLLLYLRTVIFRISQRINVISAEQRDEGDGATGKAATEFHALSRRITQFINLYQYPFLSLQQQGVEMYEMQRRNMGIDDLYREVREEVERTQAQLDMGKQMDLALASQRLGMVATIGIPLAAAALVGVVWNDLNAKLLVSKIIGALCPSAASWWTDEKAAIAGIALAAAAFLAAYRWARTKAG